MKRTTNPGARAYGSVNSGRPAKLNVTSSLGNFELPKIKNKKKTSQVLFESQESNPLYLQEV